MADVILADTRRTTREEIKQAILQRTTRGMLTYNTGRIVHLEGELWAVPSTRGGFHKVDLEVEACECEDFTFYGSAVGVACRHVYAAAIARASRRSGIRVRVVSAAGDPFRAAARRRRECPSCFGGYITMTHEEDGQEYHEAVPCRRCRPEGL